MPTNWPDQASVFALAEPLIMEFEGFRNTPYLCPAGVPTIGYGSTKYPDGRKVSMTDKPCIKAEALVYLEFAMRRVWADLQASGAMTRAPAERQGAALLSLAYNIGVGCHDGVKGDLADSSLLACFNAGDLVGAERHFLDWKYARVGGVAKILPGLVQRRMREQQLFRSTA